MKSNAGEILLITGVLLFIVGAIALVAGFIPRSAIAATGAMALIFVTAGANIKRQARKKQAADNSDRL